MSSTQLSHHPNLDPIARRTLFRLTGGLLATSAASLVAPVDARPRSRRNRKRHRRRHDATIPPVAIACDAAATSGIVGIVLIGPMCPVVSLDDPCPDRPFMATLVVRDAHANVVCTTSSREDGRFRIGLPPGIYELEPQSGHPGGLPFAASQCVTVEPGRFSEMIVNFDSGIR